MLETDPTLLKAKQAELNEVIRKPFICLTEQLRGRNYISVCFNAFLSHKCKKAFFNEDAGPMFCPVLSFIHCLLPTVFAEFN